MGKKHVRQALNIDVDNATIMRYWKGLQNAEGLKNSAAHAFKENHLEVAVGLYGQCLEFDPLNCAYNQSILFNRASAF